MAQFKDGKKLAQSQLKRAKQRLEEAKKSHEQMASLLKYEAVKLSSGTVSTKTLRRLGHPFGRRAAKPGAKRAGRQRGRLPTLPVNRQTGRLRAGWQLRKVARKGFGQSIDLRNPVKYSKYVLSPGGTRKMVTRPLWRELKKLWRKQQKEIHKSFMSK